MKNRRAVGLLSPKRHENWRQEPGGGRDDICDHGLSGSWKVDVWENKGGQKKQGFSRVMTRPAGRFSRSLKLSWVESGLVRRFHGAGLVGSGGFQISREVFKYHGRVRWGRVIMT